MTERAGRMISLEVGVADEVVGEEIAALMMGESSPTPGSERTVADGTVLSYLRSFKVQESTERTEPAVWVDFGIRYDKNVEADPLAGWLFDTLKSHASHLTLRVDTSDIALEMGAMSELIRTKVGRSV